MIKLKLLGGLFGFVGIVALGLVDPGSARPSPSSRARPVPQRLERWPLLDAWLAGGDIDWHATNGEPSAPRRELQDRGKALFGLYCVQCHGAAGRGDGPRGPLFDPPPRDLTSGVFKYRSTPAGDPPTRADLFRTISNGLRGTGMLAFADLPERDRWALVEYVRTLSDMPSNDSTPLALPTAPPDLDSAARVARGRASFARLGCVSCHGSDGNGDGPAAAALRLQRHAPRDFHAEPLRTGNDPAGVYRTLLTGLEGTPMAAYAGIAPDELWNVVAFVLDVEGQRGRARPGSEQRQARHAVVDGCGCQAAKK